MEKKCFFKIKMMQVHNGTSRSATQTINVEEAFGRTDDEATMVKIISRKYP
jgi:hypothetical protein